MKWFVMGFLLAILFFWILGCGLEAKVNKGVAKCQQLVEKLITDLEDEYGDACLSPDDVIDLMLDNMDRFEEKLCEQHRQEKIQ